MRHSILALRLILFTASSIAACGADSGTGASSTTGTAGNAPTTTSPGSDGASGQMGSAEMSGSGGSAGGGVSSPAGNGGGSGDGMSGSGGADPGAGGARLDAGTDDSSAGTGGGAGAAGAPPDAGHADVDASSLPKVTLYLAGDSTVMDNGAGSAQEGWGMELGQFLVNQVTITNEAIGGRSVQSFMYDDAANTVEATNWKFIQANIQAGDYLLVQFGANDSSGIAGRAVNPTDYEALLGTLVDAVKAKQATPILVTPSALQQWVNGKETNTRLAPYAAAVIDLGPKKSVLVDDLNARSVEFLNMIGQTAAEQVYYLGDKAHFTKYGATQIAQMVANELRRIKSPLAAYLK